MASLGRNKGAKGTQLYTVGALGVCTYRVGDAEVGKSVVAHRKKLPAPRRTGSPRSRHGPTPLAPSMLLRQYKLIAKRRLQREFDAQSPMFTYTAGLKGEAGNRRGWRIGSSAANVYVLESGVIHAPGGGALGNALLHTKIGRAGKESHA